MNKSGYVDNKIKDGRPKLLNQNMYDEILKESYNGEIDRNWIVNRFNVSPMTAYRTMQKLGLTHASSDTISIIKEYLDGATSKELAKKYNMTTTNVVNLLKRRNIERRKSVYCANYRYFENIDSEDKAYWLGFIYADGNLFKNTLKISIAESDIELLERFKKDINSNHPILIENRKDKNPTWQNAARIEITSQHIREDLIKHGVVENKTFKIEFPTTVPDELLHHFIRGYFDGDGCICIYNAHYKANGKIYSNTKYEVSIVGTESFVNSVKDIVNEIGITVNKLYIRHKNRNNNTRSLKITGKSNCIKFCEYIYKDSTVHLDRKYQKYKNIN